MSAGQNLHDAILKGDAKGALAAVDELLAAPDVNPKEIVDQFMIPAMDEVGRRFDQNEYFVPELLIAARAMKGALKKLQPLLAARKVEPVGRVVIGTVKGDLHDIGKNLVASMMEGGGFEVTDLGVDVSGERFAQAISEKGCNVVCLSALLTTTMPGMKAVIEALRTAGVRANVKVLVGGAPVTEEFAREVGADGYASNASLAVVEARKLLGVG